MGYGLEQSIPILMAQSIVDVLKVIQIQIEQCAGGTVLFRRINLDCQIPLAAHSVIQARQEIRVSLLFNAPLIMLFFRNIKEGIKTALTSVHPFDPGLIKVIPAILGFVI